MEVKEEDKAIARDQVLIALTLDGDHKDQNSEFGSKRSDKFC
jgi:hypothetical protein